MGSLRLGSVSNTPWLVKIGNHSVKMDFSFSNLSNEDRLFLAVPPSKPAVQSYTVVGGRIVASSQGHFPVNGQKLMMKLESMTSAMMNMDVSMEEEMEEETDQTKQFAHPTRGNAPTDCSLPHQLQEQQSQKQEHQIFNRTFK